MSSNSHSIGTFPSTFPYYNWEREAMAQEKEWKVARHAQVLAALKGYSQSHPMGPVQPTPNNAECHVC